MSRLVISAEDVFFTLIRNELEDVEINYGFLTDPNGYFTEKAKAVAAVALSEDYDEGHPIYDAVVEAAGRLRVFEFENGVRAARSVGYGDGVDEDEYKNFCETWK